MMRRLHADRGVDAPLLTEEEVAALLSAAPAALSPSVRPPSRGRSGEQLSSSRGGGTDFAETRVYHAGDDPRHIDWRATARSRSPLVRSYHAEFSRPSCLVVDRRSGMRFGTRVRLKVTQAVRVALWLAAREMRVGRELAALLLDDPCRWLPPERGSPGLRRLVELANAPCPPIEAGSGEPAWGKVLSGLRQRLPKGSELTIVSDFAGLGVDDLHLLRALGRHCDCHAVHIVDAAEAGLTTGGVLQLHWGGDSYQVDAASPVGLAALARQQQRWSEFLVSQFKRADIGYRQLSADADALGDVIGAA